MCPIATNKLVPPQFKWTCWWQAPHWCPCCIHVGKSQRVSTWLFVWSRLDTGKLECPPKLFNIFEWTKDGTESGRTCSVHPLFVVAAFFFVQMWSRRVGTEPPTKRRTDDAMSALLPRAVKRPELQWRGRLGSWRESSGAPARDSKANRADRTFWCSHVGLHFLLWPQKVIAGYFQVPKKVWVLGQGSKLLVTWVLNHLKVPQRGFHLAINYVAYTTIG